jgi:hypothetical protein
MINDQPSYLLKNQQNLIFSINWNNLSKLISDNVDNKLSGFKNLKIKMNEKLLFIFINH